MGVIAKYIPKSGKNYMLYIKAGLNIDISQKEIGIPVFIFYL